MEKIKKKYTLKLNSANKIEELLQELYNETNRMANEVQEQINRLSSSVILNTEPMDAKAKYAKAMNDFLTSKEKTISKKLDIAKLMTEILKFNGNVKAAVEESTYDWASMREALYSDEPIAETEDEIKEYKIKK